MKNHECSQKEIKIYGCECWLAEYMQLKFMRDKIKKAIEIYKLLLALNSKTKSYSDEEIAEIDDKIVFLRSLCE